MTDASVQQAWSIDSNIVLYCYDTSPEAALKRQRASQLVQESISRRNVLAAQVCGEVFRVLHSKMRQPSAQVLQFMNELMAAHRIAQADSATLAQAMSCCVKTNRQFWDCLIIASCAVHGIKRFYTEDTGTEPHTVMGVELVNPFLMEDWDEAFAIR